MSIQQTTVYVCDRCDARADDRKGWGGINLAHDVTRLNFPWEADLCPACLADAMRWWEAPKNVAAGKQ